MNIREYQENDRSQIEKLFLDFGNYLEEIDDMGRIHYRDGGEIIFMDQMLKDVLENNGKIFVAENNDQIIGFISGIIEKPDLERKINTLPNDKSGRITDLYIDDKYRGQGIGKQLMIKIEDYLREIGCDVIKVEVFGPNISAHKFYNNLGYRERNYDLIKELDG